MLEMARENNAEWVKCKKCGHKLFKKIYNSTRRGANVIEIKCHSCKEINLVDLTDSHGK